MQKYNFFQIHEPQKIELEDFGGFFRSESLLYQLQKVDTKNFFYVIVKDDIMPYRDEKGIFYTGLFQFLSSDKLM